MQQSRTQTWVMLVTLALVSTLLTSACGKTVGETIDDATVTTRVKTALINEPNVAAGSIDVDTFKGVVTLSGRVKSNEEATRAVEVARRTTGVKDVKSTLQVIPSS